MNPQRHQILLVEDDDDHALLIEKQLAQVASIEHVHRAIDGAEALAWLAEEDSQPDLVLLDLNLPRYSGHEVLASLRGEDATRDLPVLVVTSSSNESDADRARQLQALDVLIKPVSSQDIADVLASIDSAKLTPTPYSRPAPIAESRLAARPPGAWRILLVEDDEDHAWLIQKFIRESKIAKSVSHAESLSQARTFLQSENFDVVLLDLNLPGATVDETLTSVMAWAGGVPVVVLTAVDDIELGVRAINEGAQDYLVKLDINGAILSRALRYAIERAQSQRQLHQLTHQLQRMNSELASFSSIVAHDLRSPVGRLKWYVELLKRDQKSTLSSEAKSRLDVISQQADRMGELVADLWTYSCVGARNELGVQVRLEELTESIFLILDRPGAFTLAIEGSMPTVETHRPALEMVLRNLISNSIAHRDRQDGCVTVTAQQRGNWIEVCVADDGPGMDPQVVRQLESLACLREDGETSPLGLGLVVVQRIVKRYGGSIKVVCGAKQRGVEVRFTWPSTLPPLTHDVAN